MDSTTKDAVLRNWDELEFQDFLGNKVAILDIEGEGGTPGAAVVLAIDYKPNFYVAAHSHPTGHVEVILDGELHVGDTIERAGDVRWVPADVAYGPITSGPNGCKGLEFFPNREAVLPVPVDLSDMAAKVGDPDALLAALRDRLEI